MEAALLLCSIPSSVLMLNFLSILSGAPRRHHSRNTLQVQNRRASRCDWYRGETLRFHQLSAALRRDFLHFFRFGDFNGNRLFDQAGYRSKNMSATFPGLVHDSEVFIYYHSSSFFIINNIKEYSLSVILITTVFDW